MRREYRDIIFTLLLLLIVGWGVFEARQWDPRARLFPWVIGGTLLGLLLLQLGVAVRAVVRGKPAAGGAELDTSPDARRRTTITLAWLLGFAALIGLLGFAIGGTLATLAYLRLTARERWPISLAITAGTAVFFVVLIRFLNIPLPPGVLVERLLS